MYLPVCGLIATTSDRPSFVSVEMDKSYVSTPVEKRMAQVVT